MEENISTPWALDKDRGDAIVEDICNFIVEYINSDVTGLLSDRHIVIADQSKDGVFDDRSRFTRGFVIPCRACIVRYSSEVGYPKRQEREYFEKEPRNLEARAGALKRPETIDSIFTANKCRSRHVQVGRASICGYVQTLMVYLPRGVVKVGVVTSATC